MKRLIRLAEVRSVTGLSRTSVYRLEAEGAFPKRIPLSAFAVAWDADEVQGWVESRIAEREKRLRQRAAVGKRLAKARAQAT
jgi:prophage regulatory protein